MVICKSSIDSGQVRTRVWDEYLCCLSISSRVRSEQIAMLNALKGEYALQWNDVWTSLLIVVMLYQLHWQLVPHESQIIPIVSTRRAGVSREITQICKCHSWRRVMITLPWYDICDSAWDYFLSAQRWAVFTYIVSTACVSLACPLSALTTYLYNDSAIATRYATSLWYCIFGYGEYAFAASNEL